MSPTGLFFTGFEVLLDLKLWLDVRSPRGCGKLSFLDLPPRPSYCSWDDLTIKKFVLIGKKNWEKFISTCFLRTQQPTSYLNDEEQASMVIFHHLLDYDFFSEKLNQQFCRKEVYIQKLEGENEMVKGTLTWEEMTMAVCHLLTSISPSCRNFPNYLSLIVDPLGIAKSISLALYCYTELHQV